MWPLVTYSYEDVDPLFTAKKVDQLYGMFVFYYIVRFCIVQYDC